MSFIRQPSQTLWRWPLRTGHNGNFVLVCVFVAIRAVLLLLKHAVQWFFARDRVDPRSFRPVARIG